MLVRFPLLAAAALSLTACDMASNDQSAPAGPDTSRSFAVGGFTDLVVAGPFDVTVTTGANPSVSAQGPASIVDAMVVQVEDNRLQIRPEGRNWGRWTGASEVKVMVTVPMLTAATLAGSGDMRINRLAGERFEGTVAGAGDMDLADIAVRDLELKIAGSGEVDARGRAERADYSIAGSGDMDAAEVTAGNVKIHIAGSGDIEANASGAADVTILGSGDVNVRGGARCTVSKQGAGDVTCS